MEKLEKKKCRFDACNYERNSQALVTDHEKNCIHQNIKCKWSEHGCKFKALTKSLVEEHEKNDCEHNLSQDHESELSFEGAGKKEPSLKGARGKETSKKDKRTRRTKGKQRGQPAL